MARTKKLMVYGDQSYQRLRSTIVVLLFFIFRPIFYIYFCFVLVSFKLNMHSKVFCGGGEGGGIARYVCYTDFDSILSYINIGLVGYLFTHKL